MRFMVPKGFVYTIAVYFYAFRLWFSTILPCVLHHFTLRFAPKRTPFCTKTHSILHQNALHFAAKRTLFCTKMHYIEQQMAQNLVQMAVSWHKNSFCRIHILPLFAPKPTLARIVFLRQDGHMVAKKGTHNVKIRAKKMTFLVDEFTCWGVKANV